MTIQEARSIQSLLLHVLHQVAPADHEIGSESRKARDAAVFLATQSAQRLDRARIKIDVMPRHVERCWPVRLSALVERINRDLVASADAP